MVVQPGVSLGFYEVLSALGKGGMGEVWRARDSKLGREVAVKTLPEEFARDSERLARFEREARLLATLNHPNIASIYGLDEHQGTRFIVLELVEGETIAEHVVRGPIPVEDALRIGIQIATAVEAAHEKGVIHRDLKPANVKVTPDGKVKVLDFGLAKVFEQDPRNSSSSNSPTISPTLSLAGTASGAILGTAAYMSPEQARGTTVDPRTDTWAFGCVLFEMLTGSQVFRGEMFSDVLASVLARDPDFTLLQPNLHPRIRELIYRCLEKDPRRRWQAIGDVRIELEGIVSSGKFQSEPSPTAVPKERLRPSLPWIAAVAVVAAAAAWTLKPVPVDDPFPFRTVLTVETEDPVGPAALSPDGQSIVYSSRARAGQGRALYLRRLDQLQSTEIEGARGPSGAPAFSPDGKSIAYIAERRRVTKVSLDGGATVTLGAVPDYGGLDWSSNGDIVLGAGIDEGRQGLFRVPSAGGQVMPFTTVDASRKELSHQQPRVLADGKTVLFTLWFGTSNNAQIAAASLDDGKVIPLGVSGIKALGVIEEHLVYVAAGGRIMAVSFDSRTLRTSGAPMPVDGPLRVSGSGGSDSSQAFLTHEGGLVFLRGSFNRKLVWVDRAGRALPVLDAVREFSSVRLSPDGRYVATVIVTGDEGDLWVLDMAAGTLSRITTTGTTRNPNWSADGRRILYASTHGGRAAFWWHPADGSGPPVMAADPPHNPWHADLSSDGKSVIFNSLYNGTFNLETLSLDPGRESREVSASTTAAESRARFSPDGRWVAYQSDESGRFEVYVRPVAQAAGRVAISGGGGEHPVWGKDGKQLYYWEGGRLVSATLTLDPEPRIVSREALFEGNYDLSFDVSKDGGRFLMIESGTSGLSLVVVPHWRTELRRLAAEATR